MHMSIQCRRGMAFKPYPLSTESSCCPGPPAAPMQPLPVIPAPKPTCATSSSSSSSLPDQPQEPELHLTSKVPSYSRVGFAPKRAGKPPMVPPKKAPQNIAPAKKAQPQTPPKKAQPKIKARPQNKSSSPASAPPQPSQPCAKAPPPRANRVVLKPAEPKFPPPQHLMDTKRKPSEPSKPPKLARRAVVITGTATERKRKHQAIYQARQAATFATAYEDDELVAEMHDRLETLHARLPTTNPETQTQRTVAATTTRSLVKSWWKRRGTKHRGGIIKGL